MCVSYYSGGVDPLLGSHRATSIHFVQLLGLLQNDMNMHVYIKNTGTQCVHQADPMRTPVNVILSLKSMSIMIFCINIIT